MDAIKLDKAAMQLVELGPVAGAEHPNYETVMQEIRDADLVIGPDDVIVKNRGGGVGSGAQFGQLERARLVRG